MSVTVRINRFHLPKAKSNLIGRIEFRGELLILSCCVVKIQGTLPIIKLHKHWCKHIGRVEKRFPSLGTHFRQIIAFGGSVKFLWTTPRPWDKVCIRLETFVKSVQINLTSCGTMPPGQLQATVRKDLINLKLFL